MQGELLKADLHDATLTHATSLPRAYNMTWDHLQAHDFFRLQNLIFKGLRQDLRSESPNKR